MRYRINDGEVAWRIADGEAVLLHADTSAYFGLNRVGTILWSALAARSMTADELTEWAVRQFPDSSPQLAAEVPAFLEQLRANDLLEEAGPTDPTDPGPATPPPEPGLMEYQPPELLPYGELEKLILSGE